MAVTTYCKLIREIYIWKTDFFSSKISIYHCTSSTCNPFRWASVKDQVNDYLHKYPLKSAVWYPHLKFLSSLKLYKLSAVLVHFIPAYFLDLTTKIFGGRPILVRLHTNVWESLNRLEKFIFSEWKFNNPNVQELCQQLSAEDKQLFNIDIKSLQWPDYFIHLAQGVRRYLNNEHPKTLPAARKKNSILFVVDMIFKIFLLTSIWMLTSKLLGISTTSSILIIPILYLIFRLL
uniref:Fatty acyl-CoA reductase CG8306 n=1 Tax=Culex pipiens TaxID=7175 RepID=A0A8D8JDB1_CULPI